MLQVLHSCYKFAFVLQKNCTPFSANQNWVIFSCILLRAHDCKYRESLARPKKIENSDNLSEKTLWGLFEKNIFNFQESIVFEKMRKTYENSGFYLINYANIIVKMTYFIASVPRQAIKQKYFCLKEFYLFFLSMVCFKP